MKPRQITVRISRTVNLGNFNSFKLDLEEVADLDPGESEGEAIDAVYEYLEAKLQKKIEDVLP